MDSSKKSVIVYTEWIESFEDLTDQEAGVLIKHFFKYINDMNPKLEDRILLANWKFIERSLKRDLEKWDNIKEKRSCAGKKSAEVKALKKIKQTSTKSTLVEFVETDSTKSTVNGNVNVNVNVNDNDILLKKETKKLFNDWLNYRKEIKKPIRSEKSKIALAKKIKKEGFEISEKVINRSIENSYQGLFWEKFTPDKQNSPKNIDLTASEKLKIAMINLNS
jgi:hypothetical protein